MRTLAFKLKLKIKRPKVLLISHSDADGIASAAISLNYATRVLKYNERDIEIIFGGPSALPHILRAIRFKGEMLIITDISPNIKELQNICTELRRLKSENWKIIWIDHHKWVSTAQNMIKGLVDMLVVEKAPSAAQLAFNYLTPKMKRLWRTVKYANDIDTLSDKFKESFTIRALTYNSKWKRKLLKKFARGKPVDKEILEIADEVRKNAEIEVERAMSSVKIYESKGRLKFGFLDLRKAKIPKSWIARRVAEKHNLKFMVVLRSNNAISLYGRIENKDINLLPIALSYGGGGHPYACGFKIKLSFKSKILLTLLGKKYIPQEVIEVIESIKSKI